MTTERKNEIEKLCTEIKELENFADDIKNDIESKKDKIKAIMTEEDENEVRTNVFHIVWKIVKSPYFDKKACAVKYDDILKMFTTEKETRPFKIL